MCSLCLRAFFVYCGFQCFFCVMYAVVLFSVVLVVIGVHFVVVYHAIVFVKYFFFLTP